MTVGDRGEPFETFVAIDVMHPPQDLLGGRTGEVAAGLADLGEQCDVLARVAARIKGGAGRFSPWSWSPPVRRRRPTRRVTWARERPVAFSKNRSRVRAMRV